MYHRDFCSRRRMIKSHHPRVSSHRPPTSMPTPRYKDPMEGPSIANRAWRWWWAEKMQRSAGLRYFPSSPLSGLCNARTRYPPTRSVKGTPLVYKASHPAAPEKAQVSFAGTLPIIPPSSSIGAAHSLFQVLLPTRYVVLLHVYATNRWTGHFPSGCLN